MAITKTAKIAKTGSIIYYVDSHKDRLSEENNFESILHYVDIKNWKQSEDYRFLHEQIPLSFGQEMFY